MPASYNGWPASPNPRDLGITALTVGTESFSPGVRSGDVHLVFQYLVDQLHARVERADFGHQADDWGYAYRPNKNDPSSLSCHASGTAIDYNATRHPNGKEGTFTPGQVREIRRILAELDGVIRWGGDFGRTKDEMHFEIRGTPAAVAVVADRLRVWPLHPPGTQVPPRTPETEVDVAAVPIVREGATGQAVRNLQGLLNAHDVEVDIDGDFGPRTVAAVKAKQAAWGIDVDGIVGLATWTALTRG